MSSRTCPDWPVLMELAPDLQFKHYTVAEAHLPAEALGHLAEQRLGELEICCDLEHNVYNVDHTDPTVPRHCRRHTGSTCANGRRPVRAQLRARGGRRFAVSARCGG